MKFKTFTWPHNPSTYHVTFQRVMAVNKVPFGKYSLQDLGVTRRVIETLQSWRRCSMRARPVRWYTPFGAPPALIW
jgi:hypothetical protein